MRLFRLPLLLLLCCFMSLTFASEKPAAGHSMVPPPEAPAGLQRFSTALGHIKEFYVKDTKDKALFDNALRGMLEGLDPHSTYLDKEAFDELKTSTRGRFAGLGIEIDMHEQLVRVVSPIDDTPAAKAGIQPGDLIFRIDDKPVKGMKMSDAVKLLRGDEGSKVTLTILRDGAKEPLTVPVTREIIKVESVKGEILEKQYAYLRIRQFQEKTVQNLEEMIHDLKESTDGKLKGVILDMRNNPGGLLDAAVGVSDLFLDKNNKLKHDELIVYTEGRIPGADFKARATEGDMLQGLPMVVLVNAGSASASEIVAGALQDHRRAIVMGEKTFGKGSVQTVLPLDENRAIKLTTAIYYTPSGRSIQAKGIEPDITVKAISIPDAKDNKTWEVLTIRENDLSGHIKNEKGSKNADKQKVAKDKLPLIHRDFQLYQAVNLLKGLNALAKDGG